mmetsp:Transcript_33261/g.55773  ORF Transcript_33261/g.55773 Transcript_33261/m.55773 type:complete len:299 (-) Transcript_33261:309-1205(-)|eukprot:CAMPEP_0198206338 /NCGR_PEP_ID=MMETSP1445-20131203/9861_1 /TAXON_ID=36898 /ORGANISM="Pyramimonas sp., Strain CCMP2087" /LENGTH=298 /DNA_ID=CAMNT_0043878995 /DNA_START=67 /DNA_END=963 /DNA_ORIENTATION=-
MTGRPWQKATCALLLGLFMVSVEAASSLEAKMGRRTEVPEIASEPTEQAHAEQAYTVPVVTTQLQPEVDEPQNDEPHIDEPLPPKVTAEAEHTSPPETANELPIASEPAAITEQSEYKVPMEEPPAPRAETEKVVENEPVVSTPSIRTKPESARENKAASPPAPDASAREVPIETPPVPDRETVKSQRARRSDTLNKLSDVNRRETSDLIKAKFEKAVPSQAGHEYRPARPNVANPTDAVKERSLKLRADREAKLEQLARQREHLNQNAAAARAGLKVKSDKIRADAMAKAQKKRDEL